MDLRSNIAAESRAKIVYEYLLQFTDDPYVKETLGFLMTREITHFQQFEAALDTIVPNFPPGTLQGDPRYSNMYFNMSCGEDARGPWNEGESSRLKEEWQYVEDPKTYVQETDGLTTVKPQGTDRTEEKIRKTEKEIGKQRSKEVNEANPVGEAYWSVYKPSTK